MVGRIPRLTQFFYASLESAGVAKGSAQEACMRAEIRRMLVAAELPGAADRSAFFRSIRGNVRAVQGAALWILYSVVRSDGSIYIYEVTEVAPPLLD